VYGGAMDIARDNTGSGLRLIRKFVQKCADTNVLILNAHERFDLSATSCVSKEAVDYNSKISELINGFDFVQVVKVNLNRQHYVR
jgi:ActR/RegA family two-component response regulator